MNRLTVFVLILFFTGCVETKSTDDTIVDSNTEKISESDEVVDIYHFNSPPHIFIDENGILTGSIYDFIEEGIAPVMGIKFNWVRESTSIPRQIKIIQNDTNAAIALLSKNEERNKIMAYTETPYFRDRGALVVLKNDPLNKIESADDILNMKIGYAEGGFRSQTMQDEALEFDLTSYSDYHMTNLKKLDLGRIDAVYGPGKTTLAYIIQEQNLTAKIKILDMPDKMTPYYIIFSNLSPELVERYNKAFIEINGEQLYKQKLSKYIDIDVLSNSETKD